MGLLLAQLPLNSPPFTNSNLTLNKKKAIITSTIDRPMTISMYIAIKELLFYKIAIFFHFFESLLFIFLLSLFDGEICVPNF
jgi:hypothetical protein